MGGSRVGSPNFPEIYGYWWLRSPGGNCCFAAPKEEGLLYDPLGNKNAVDYRVIKYNVNEIFVRPVMWVNY